MSNPVTRIQMSGFRGATSAFEIEFDPAKDLTMLCGENGSGKSTILDAIDVVCNESIGCLEGISVGQSPSRYLCALGSPTANLQVTVHSTTERWTGAMQRNAITVSGGSNRPIVKILRRNRILDLVTAQPSERYRALSRFIEVGTVERSESALQQGLNDTRQQITILTRDKDRMVGQLDEIWIGENRPGPGQTANAWAEDRVNTGMQNLSDQMDRLKAVTEAIAAAATARTEYETRNNNHSDVSGQLAQVNQQIENAPGLSSGNAVQLLESLEKAKAYIEADNSLDKCPTCKRPMERDQLLGIVNQQLDQLAELKSLTDNRQRIRRSLTTAESHLNEAKSALAEALKAVQELILPGNVPELMALNIDWPKWERATDNPNALVAICDQLASVEAPLVQQCESAQRAVGQFNSIKNLWNDIREAEEKMADLDRIRVGLQRAHEIVHQKRVSFTQSILDDICQEANRLFQEIHPSENIGLEQHRMDEQRRSSVNQSGSFNGHSDVPPQAIFSESHMDTLGFCVWLALAKREMPEETVLLIDDIFTSVDSAHLGRVIDLLNTEASNFLQVIIATHYRLWWDRCQNAQNIQRVHLGRWCPTNGIAAQNMPRVLNELRTKVEEAVLDRQAVSSKAGILLESILDDLTLLFECALPRNNLNSYTLGVLLNGCSKLFGKHNLTVKINSNWNADGQPENWEPTAAKTTYERVNALQFIRNQVGCHFSPPGMEIPDDEVRDFGAATIALVEALTCPNCGALATKTGNDGTHLLCSCPKKAARMTPVAIP